MGETFTYELERLGKNPEEVDVREDESLASSFEDGDEQDQENKEKPERDIFKGVEHEGEMVESEVLKIAEEFRERAMQDTQNLEEMAKRLELSEEDQVAVRNAFQKAQEACLNKEASLRSGVLERIRQTIEAAKLKIPAAALATIFEIAGCASGGRLERIVNAQHERIIHPEEKRFFEEMSDAARNESIEKSYMYGITKEGKPVFLGEPCAIGDRFSIRGETDKCSDFVDGLCENQDIERVVHLHIHPLESTADADKISPFVEDHTSEEDRKEIREGEGLGGVIPPSMTDALGVSLPNEIRKEDDKEMELRVADTSGIWTYSIDREHPFMKMLINENILASKKLEQVASEIQLSPEDKELFNKIMRTPGMTTSNEKVNQALQNLYQVQNELGKNLIAKEENIQFMREYEQKQFELASELFNSREDLLEAVDEFIEYAATKGILLRYDSVK